MRFPCFLAAVGILALAAQSSCAEDLTTLDGKKYADITDISKYPKQVYFTSNSNRIGVAITNLPEDFLERHGIIKAAMSHPTNDGAILFQPTPKLTEADRKKFEETKAKAEAGDAQAQSDLGSSYCSGLGTPVNESEGVKWYRKSAEQGNAAGENGLGWSYLHGSGVAKNPVEAIKWLVKSAEQGNAKAQSNLGYCYEFGDGVQKDIIEAVELYRKAAEQGDAMAQRALGCIYIDGIEVAKDPVEAIKWYLKAAEQGDTTSQDELGRCYADGVGVPKDPVEAVKWWRKAAEQGEFLSEIALADCYRDGKGVEKNPIEAAKWYAKARGDTGDLTGQPPNEQQTSSTSSVGAAPVTNTRPDFEIVSLSTKVMEANDVWWRWSYQLRVKNNTSQPIHEFPHLQFLDAQGYIIAEKTCEVKLSADETKTFLGTTLVDLPGAASVKTIKAE